MYHRKFNRRFSIVSLVIIFSLLIIPSLHILAGPLHFLVDAECAILQGETVYAHSEISRHSSETAVQEQEYRHIPVLTYHHLDFETKNDCTISPDLFEEHLASLVEAGYEGISSRELIAFVEGEGTLPEKPILITFDDGYRSNFDFAFPLLKKYGMKAEIFPIGISIGKRTYKETDHEIIPHFGQREIDIMVASGLISIHSHTYDMHQVEAYDGADFRQGVLKKSDETEVDYFRAFCEDVWRSRKQLSELTGESVVSFAYPYGMHDARSELFLKQLGFKVTLTSVEGTNTVVRGMPETLRRMKRIRCNERFADGISLLERIQSE